MAIGICFKVMQWSEGGGDIGEEKLAMWIAQFKLGDGRWGFVKLFSLLLYMFEYFH